MSKCEKCGKTFPKFMKTEYEAHEANCKYVGTGQKPDTAEKIKAIRNFLCQPNGVLYDTPELHLICDVLDELEQLQKQLAEKDKMIEQQADFMALAQEQLDAYKKQIKKLKEIIGKYCEHIECPAWDAGGQCTCGLEQALKEVKE